MAEVTRPAGLAVSYASVLPNPQSQISGLVAGEDLIPGDMCYIAADGTAMKATGAAATAPAKVRGMALSYAGTGEAVTLGNYAAFRYATALTPGTTLYLSGVTAGNLATAASTGGVAPIGFVIDAQRIYIFPAAY